MDMDQAAVFLAGSILTGLGMIIAIGTIVAINNIISIYWKPVRLFTSDSWAINSRYISPEEYKEYADKLAELEKSEKIEPIVDNSTMDARKSSKSKSTTQ